MDRLPLCVMRYALIGEVVILSVSEGSDRSFLRIVRRQRHRGDFKQILRFAQDDNEAASAMNTQCLTLNAERSPVW